LHIYGLLLLLSIPLYYAVVLAAIGFLFESQKALLREGVPLWQLGLCLLAWVLIVRLGVYLWSGIRAVVTPLHDEQSEPEGMKLDPAKHVELWEELEEVGGRMQAPFPDEIYISHRPECYATELRWFGFSTHRRLVLVLGLPHLAVLSLSELKVIVAHELAHFGGGDTRLSVFLFRFLRTLDRFLNALDRNVERARQRWWRWLDPVYWYAWGYFHVVRGLSAPFSRYQELRADRRSAEAYGGDLAERTLLKEWQIQPRFDAAVASFCDQNGPDYCPDAFSWFARGWSDFSPAGYKYLENRLSELEYPSFWDTHPTMQARLKAVRVYPARNSVQDRPARDLLDDFPHLAARLHEQFFALLEFESEPEERDVRALPEESAAVCYSTPPVMDVRMPLPEGSDKLLDPQGSPLPTRNRDPSQTGWQGVGHPSR